MAYRKSEVSRYHSEITLIKCFKIINMVFWRKLNAHSIHLFLFFPFVPQSKVICLSGTK